MWEISQLSRGLKRNEEAKQTKPKKEIKNVLGLNVGPIGDDVLWLIWGKSFVSPYNQIEDVKVPTQQHTTIN